MPTRQPIVCVVGHIDHGKTTLLDKIRHSTVQLREAKGITQHIGASEIPIDVIRTRCGKLFSSLNQNISIPGILMIDTPGHAAFTSLRKRGSTIADLSVLVINILEGVMPQTIEAIELLKEFKVPFVVAATKVDVIPGWRPTNDACFLESFNKQSSTVQMTVEEKVYNIVGELSKYGFQSDRFDRISDYTKQIAVVPCSGVTGEGISELLLVLTGLAQKFLENQLKIEITGPAKGSVIEVKEITGLGRAMDVVIFDGTVKVGDTVVIGGLTKPIVTKVRALLKPSPLKELREKGKFESMKEVSASAGIRISAPDIDDVVAGVPFEVVNEKERLESVKKEMEKSLNSIKIETENKGIIIKAESLGSLEATIFLFKKANIPIRRAGIGEISKSDVMEAADVAEKDQLLSVVMGFNVIAQKEIADYVETSGVKVMTSNVIYELLDGYEKWRKEKIEQQKREELAKLTMPSKVKLLPEYIFRQSNPAVVGVEVIAGEIKQEYLLLNANGSDVGRIKQIQKDGKDIDTAKAGEKVAISIPGAVIGRSIDSNEELIIDVNEEEFKTIKKKFIDYVSEESKKVMDELVRIKRKKKPTWGF